MSLLLLSQTLLLPLVLSILFSLKNYQRLYNSIGILIIWLISYFWILGIATLHPAEALDWIWLSNVALIAVCFIIKQPIKKLTLVVVIFVISLGIYSWPLIEYNLELSLILEIIFIASIAIIIFIANSKSPQSINNSVIIICISTLGFAFVVALIGSLLIAQLAIVLAAILSGFIVKSIWKNSNENNLTPIQLIITVNIYLSLLFIAMLYTELSLIVSSLLALSPLTLILQNNRFNWLINLLLNLVIFIWVLITTNTQSYY